MQRRPVTDPINNLVPAFIFLRTNLAGYARIKLTLSTQAIVTGIIQPGMA